VKPREEPAFTKSLLVESVRQAVELSPEQASGVVEAVFESMIEELQRGGKVAIRRFGSFRRRERGARQGRNPLTGTVIEVPPKSVVYFTPSQELRRLLAATVSTPPLNPGRAEP
jgi:integration host factor subunit beta